MGNIRLQALRNNMKKEGVDLYYLNTSDYHMSEYVPEYFKTIAYFSYFTGSLATLLVSLDNAYIFVDGRYHNQAEKQCTKNGVNVIKLGLKDALEPIDFIKKYYSKATVGIDGKRTSMAFGKQLEENGIAIKSVDLYSDIIENRASLSNDNIYELSEEFTGLSRKKKIELITHCLNNKCHIVSNLESIAYLLNLRSSDILYTPVFLAYLVILDKKVYLFVNEKRLDETTLNKLHDDGVVVYKYDEFYTFLLNIKERNIVIDDNKVNYEIYNCIRENNNIICSRSIIEDMKSIKNDVEQRNIKLAHIYDGVAMLRFLMWLDKADKSQYNEYQIAKMIDKSRLAYKAFDLSFNSIVSYNENAAVIHYSPSKENSKQLDNSGILLMDTGGQYLYGTTDITRTVALGEVDPEVKKAFTLVLKSMFNISELKFMKGLAGNQIDVLARQDLWAHGLDYRHGTGHGVGYVLSVHEGPPNIRYMHTEARNEEVELKNGMIFSDEPGLYFDNKFGIRCENLLLCKNDYENEYGQFMKFETLTLVPFDLNLIDMDYMDEKTINALNNYHERVYITLLPYLNSSEAKYLKYLTRKI